MSPRDAIYLACLLRFRPIMMITMCALLGGMPMALGWGAGASARSLNRGAVSQMLTLVTTPVIFLYFDKIGKRLSRRKAAFKNRPSFLTPGGLAESAD